MKHEYTDTQLQSAIEEACLKIHREHRKVGSTLIIAQKALPSAYAAEEDVRLDLIKSALAALPDPPTPTVDGKTPGEFYSNLLSDSAPDEYYSWAEMSSEMRAEMQSRLAAVLSAFGKQSQSQPQLSQLRPIAEAGEVPEGYVRYYTYKKDGEWTTKSKYRAMQDTHYIDTRLPESAEKPELLVTKPISLPTPNEAMSLRDYFAGQALANLYTQAESNPDKIAEWSYHIADAMLAAREVKP